MKRFAAIFLTLVLAFACAASFGYWALKLLAKPLAVPADAQAVGRLDTDALVAAIVAEARDGDRILVMSNGGFGGIHGKLLAALAG